jgi:hypothetical protein
MKLGLPLEARQGEAERDHRSSRVKVPQFQRRHGSLSEGPRIVDQKKQHLDGAAIGNGSNLVVIFNIYGWDGEKGCGMTFQPRVVQVFEFVPYEQDDPADGFDELDGYKTGSSPQHTSSSFSCRLSMWVFGGYPHPE